jgi:hypothetical protein
MATSAMVALSAAPAYAHPVCGGGYIYSLAGTGTEWVPTNVHSDWMEPGIIATKSLSGTSTWTATFTLSAGVDAGVIFAKVSASTGFSVAKTWSQTSGWSYSGGPRIAKVGRLMIYHRAAYSDVTKTEQYTNCTTKKIYTTRVVAPLKANDNLVGIQYE